MFRILFQAKTILVAAQLSATISAPAQEWTWIKGSANPNATGVYGTQEVSGSANTPGSRLYGSAWTDGEGNFWLFGGSNNGPFNDLWKFAPAVGEWIWMKGSSSQGAASVGGTQGAADPANTPGARSSAASWSDGAGNLWLYGGNGVEVGFRGDLWRYNIAAGNWTWVNGSLSNGETPPTYGSKEIAASSNTPGSRVHAMTWVDLSGKLWLFGGRDSAGPRSDLWNYDPGSGMWTWMAGSTSRYAAGTYGTQGVEDPQNTPGARLGGGTWTDRSGNLWLFGGHRPYEIYNGSSQYEHNDLWRFNPSTGMWAWMGGGQGANEPGVYGTQGVEAPENTPGARLGAVTWTDAGGKFWLFGGLLANSSTAFYNDFWRYNPATGSWAWMGGGKTSNVSGIYGTQGVAADGNRPGARNAGVAWRDQAGSLWLFGGEGYGQSSGVGILNDLWKTTPAPTAAADWNSYM